MLVMSCRWRRDAVPALSPEALQYLVVGLGQPEEPAERSDSELNHRSAVSEMPFSFIDMFLLVTFDQK